MSLDVYGLGVLTYLLVTGQAPAASQSELHARLEAEEGLRPSSLVDGLSEDIDFLVQSATAYNPRLRMTTVDEFLEALELVEDVLTAPPHPSEPENEKDPLEAVAGDVLGGGRWEVRRRLGTGSTSRAFLVRDREAEVRRTRPLAVLKIALSDSRGDILRREAEIMGQLRPDSRVIRLVGPEPLTIAERTVLALEYVGDEREEPSEGPESTGKRARRREETVARQLRDRGRLQMDQLEVYGDYLFGAVDFLEGESVWHRDIKPDNIAIRVRPNRTRELVLIDFSLAGYPAREFEAGTEGYLDPFIGQLTRTAYDSHAERYAVAVTLHQMASGELPKWGDGSVLPRQTDPEEYPHPVVAADAFEPAVRDDPVAFFHKALHRDVARRFPELKPMRDAWRKIFLDATLAVPSSRSRASGAVTAERAEGDTPAIADAEPLTAEQHRDQLAKDVTRETHLFAAGLTPAAESFLYGLGLTTVGGLLDHSRRKLLNAPGLGAKTRGEVQRRQREWGELLREAPLSPLTPRGRAEAKEELEQLTVNESAVIDALATEGKAAGLSAPALRSVSLDTIATILVPELNNNGSNRSKVGGRSWQVTFIDWARKRVYVEPADGGGVAKWTSGSLIGLSFALARTMREILLGADPPVSLTRRAELCLATWREEEAHEIVDPGGTLVVRQGGDVRWWTWAGYRANATLAATLSSIADPVQRPTDCYVRLREDLTRDMWRASREAAGGGAVLVLPDVDRRAVQGLKFSTALPERLAVATVAARLADFDGARTALQEPVRFQVGSDK
ncbi:hypothetical protein [Streptomyces sp. IB2014 016-6]|uniref:protein kinase domain-containing protein n=1 Tax=Streptomyces sp. IB2014 016-6 TaxID=2517818 RepID=UPI001F4F727E|nr:hypothetical protein [Streptomyces sp. IB2014 016-6]